MFTAGESLEIAKITDLVPAVISNFFLTRFVGALNTVRVSAPRIAAGGSITMTSGTATHQPGFGVLPVSVCGAMNAATTALAVELAPIRVNAVAPGVVRTPLWDAMGGDSGESMFDQSARELPLGRIGEVEDVARAYVYAWSRPTAPASCSRSTAGPCWFSRVQFAKPTSSSQNLTDSRSSLASGCTSIVVTPDSA